MCEFLQLCKEPTRVHATTKTSAITNADSSICVADANSPSLSFCAINNMAMQPRWACQVHCSAYRAALQQCRLLQQISLGALSSAALWDRCTFALSGPKVTEPTFASRRVDCAHDMLQVLCRTRTATTALPSPLSTGMTQIQNGWAPAA